MRHQTDNFARRSARAGLAALVIGAVALGGCSDSTSPSEAFDPVAADSAADEILATFDNNPALTSLDVLSAAFPDFSGGAPPFAPPVRDETTGWLGERDPLLERLLPFMSPAEAAVIFPEDLLGKTLVYNPDSSKYEVSLERTGAPSNGVRLILYAVDPILRQPVVPLNEIGYLDLTDQTTASANRLGITAVIGEVTYLDYVASAVVTTTSVTFSAEGFISDGTTQVNFSLSHEWSATQGVTVSYGLSVPSSGDSVSLVLNVDPQTQQVTITFTITHSGDTLVLTATGTDTSISGSVSFNGETVITISGTPDQPVFTDADGNPVAPEQLAALHDIFNGAEKILDHFADLLKPAYAVLQVSIFNEL